MKNNLNQKMPKKYNLRSSWIIILFIVILIFSYFYLKYIKDLTYQNIYNNITEISEQTATQLKLSIKDQMNFVQLMVDSINRGYFDNHEEIFDRYKGDLANHHFTRLVILDREGNGTTSDGYTVNNYKDIDEFFDKDIVYLSENKPSTVSNNQVNIYSKTFMLNNEEYVLMATINTENYTDILLRRLFGKGGTYLINSNGSILINTFECILGNSDNLFEHLKVEHTIKDNDSINKIEEMELDIKEKRENTIDIKLDSEVYFIHYENLGINDWYVVTVASENTIAEELMSLIILSMILCLIVNFVVIMISIYIDISNQKKKKELYKVAYIDSITGFGNENYFRENATEFLKEQNKNLYVMVFDINKFKALNNIYGYDFCNEVLKQLGENVEKLLPERNIISRISNDVYASIYEYNNDITKLLDKIFNKASYLKVRGIDLHVNISIGLYKVKTEKDTINECLDKAYMARHKIKGLYNQNYYIFDKALEDKLIEEQQIESCMEEALKNHEFRVIYQPKMYTKNEKISGAEALVRWYKGDKVIPPYKFIPLFEKNKFIIKLDLYVFEQACKDLATWKEKYNFTPVISINVSKEHFVNSNFIDKYVEITDIYKLDRSKIDLEITESATIDENVDILKILDNIKAKGFMISIDDFGTGDSSLSMIQNLPIDVIKIDKVFIDNADLNTDKNIFNYIMSLAKHLEVKTIAEGVETKEQVEFVRNSECDIIQGYYYSKPITKEEFEEYFNKYR